MALTSINLLWPSLVSAVVSTICALLMIVLIQKLKWTGYLFVIRWLSISQILYDISFLMLINESISSHIFQVSSFLNTFGAISSILWTNVLSFTVLYLIINKQAFLILKHPIVLFLLATLPALVLAFVQFRYQEVHQVSVSTAILIIDCGLVLFNCVSYVLCSYFPYTIAIENKQTSNLANSLLIRRNRAILSLLKRIKYYPLYQVFLRLMTFWFHYSCQCSSLASLFVSSDDETSYLAHEDVSSTSAAVLLYEIFAPSASIGYLVIFLIMQPDAWQQLLVLFHLDTCFRANEPTPDEMISADAENRVRSSRIPTTSRAFPSDTLWQFMDADINMLDDDSLVKVVDSVTNAANQSNSRVSRKASKPSVSMSVDEGVASRSISKRWSSSWMTKSLSDTGSSTENSGISLPTKNVLWESSSRTSFVADDRSQSNSKESPINSSTDSSAAVNRDSEDSRDSFNF